MYSKPKFVSALLLVVAVAYQCSSALQLPTNQEAVALGISLDTLALGRRLYIGHCSSCHNLYLPNRLTKTEWVAAMDSMQAPAKITDAQKQIILQYLQSKSRFTPE